MLYTQLCLYEQRGTCIYKNISLILFSKEAHSLLFVWEIDRETYTQRGPFFFREPRSADSSTRLQAVSSEMSETPLIGRLSLARLSILCTLSKSDRVVITWSPSGYTPIGPDRPGALPSLCLLITTWQLDKALGVTRNEPKIHVICYITYIYNNVGDHRRGWLEDFLFLAYYTEGRALLLSRDCSTLPLIRTSWYWVLRKKASSSIFWVFGMTQRRIEPRCPGPLANTLLIRPTDTRTCKPFFVVEIIKHSTQLG